jgi:hypothetical protein
MIQPPLLRHVVLLTFHATTSAEQITQVGEAFCALPASVSAITALEWGIVINQPNKYSACLLVTCKSQSDFEDYENHPAHQAIATTYGHLVEDVAVVDYWIGT